MNRAENESEREMCECVCSPVGQCDTDVRRLTDVCVCV